MRSRYISALLFSLVFCIFSVTFGLAWGNSPPFVSNVRAQQRAGTKLVDITYDVSDYLNPEWHNPTVGFRCVISPKP